ncbi:protein kinase [Legionella israelensis]|uniref:protein kinase domain-containing protein n=1 Tax=Legionella israelensis TaxID=454 RepID=UPI00117F0BF3|nr:protein kinase [Legionella israelensis]QDP72424.1 protein kinase [Legionella israelensis]
MPYRHNKSQHQRFTTISTDEGTYELWNSLTSSEEKWVIEQLRLEKGSLPLSKKDEQQQRLLFGAGQFGKVRLANKNGKLFAVKKMLVNSQEEMDSLLREYYFGKLLENANIPHASYGTDGAILPNARGHSTFYLFIDKVASLGDGDKLKSLLKYIESEEQRTQLLSYVAHSLLKSAKSMHAQHIYHRDIKASNILLNSTGQVYLSDFGSAICTNQELISNLFNEGIPQYEVSNKTDLRYMSPEFHIAIASNISLPVARVSSSAYYDNWRLGLTLLQLCGAIKEGEGILASPNHPTHHKDGSVSPGWLTELKEKAHGEELAQLINARYEKEIEKIKRESLHKIPTKLQEIIFGLLDLDATKRLTSSEAYKQLQDNIPSDTKLVEEGFKNIVHSQIAVIVKNGIKKALKTEAESFPKDRKWLNNALEQLKVLLKAPHTTAKDIEAFVNLWISNKNNLPNYSLEHYEAALDRIKKIHALQNDEVFNEPDISFTASREEKASLYSAIPPNAQVALHPEQPNEPNTDSSTPKLKKKSPYGVILNAAQTELTHESVHSSMPEIQNEENHYTPLKPQEEGKSDEFLPEDPEFARLTNAFKKAAEEFSAYVKAKASKNSEAVKESERILHNVKKGVSHIKDCVSSDPVEITNQPATKITPTQSMPKETVDESALNTVYNRTIQILKQLTLGRLMRLSQQEAVSVERMLEKDKQFFERIAERTTLVKPEILKQISEKLLLLKKLTEDQQVYVSTQPIDTTQLLTHETEAKVYRAHNKKTNSEYIFSESAHMRAYQLPSSDKNIFPKFVAHETLNKTRRPEEIYIYTSKEMEGKTLSTSLADLKKHGSKLKIYINDQLVTSKAHSNKKWFRFFEKEHSKKISNHQLNFTFEEISPITISLKK